jgi:WD40 repeat protein
VTTPVRALPHDGKRLTRVKFQPGGELLLTVDAERRWRVWDWLQEKPLAWADGREAGWAFAWSPDGRHLAVGANAGGVEIRDVSDGKVLHRLEHPGRVTALAFSRDGNLLAVGSSVVRVWDVRVGEFTGARWKHPQRVITLGFNATGDRLATGCSDDTARLFDIAGQKQDTSPVLGPVDHLMTFSPVAPVFVDEDRRVVTATARGPVVWNIDEGTSIATQSLNWQRRGSVAASGDGKMFVASGHGQAGIFRADGTSVATLPHHHILPTLAISPDDSTVLVASFDRVATLWSIAGEPLETLPHQSPVSHVDFSSDGRYLVTGQIDGLVRVWRRPKGTPGDRLLPYHAAGFATPELKFGSEGRLGIVSSYRWHNMSLRETTARVFDLTRAKQIGPDLPLSGRLRDAALSPDGKTAAAVNVSAARGELRVWDIRSGRDSFAPLLLPDVPDGVTFHPSGDRVAVLCRGGQLLFVDALTGKKSLEVRLHASQDRAQGWRTFGSVEFTADGSTLVALRPFDVSVLDAQTGKLRFEPIEAPSVEAGQSVNFTEVQISHDGRLLAASLHLESKGSVQVFDAATGQPLCDPLPHADGVYRVRFSPDDRHLLTACSDNEARLWDWRTGRLVCPPSRHDDGVYGIGFTPNGRWMITASRDNTMRFWDARTGRPVAPPRKLNNPFNDGSRFLEITRDGRHVITNGSDEGFLMVDLSDLYNEGETEDVDELITWAELIAGQRIFDADLSGLTNEDWLTRWRSFRNEHPEEGTPTIEETIERHRRAALMWLERGRADAALVHVRRLNELAAALPNADPQLAAELDRLKMLLFSEEIVSSDSTWQWLHPTDGVDPATNDQDFHTTFHQADFDDSDWNSGQDSPGHAGGFGYGQTVGVDIGTPRALRNRKTAYFRHKFTTDKTIVNLSIRMQRDDGVIIYLDGKEIARDNVSSAADTYDLYTIKHMRGSAYRKRRFIRLPGVLQPGEHILAISLHNCPGGSSDLRIAEISLHGTPRE